MLRIAFVTHNFPPMGWGGIGTYVWQMTRALKSRAVHITVVTGATSADDSERDVCVSDKLRVLRVLPTSPIDTVRTECARVLSELIKSPGLDLVEFAEYAAYGLHFQRLYPDFPTVVRLHGDTELCYFASIPPFKRAYKRLLNNETVNLRHNEEGETVRRAHFVTAPTQWTLEQAHKRGWSHPQAAVIANPFLGFPESTEPHPSEPVGQHDVVLLGRVDYRKGAEFYPSLIKHIHAVAPKTKFRIIGQPDVRRLLGRWGSTSTYPDWILRSVPESSRRFLDFSGGVPYEAVGSHLEGCRVAVHLSKMETFGYTHVETMFSGLPTVIGSLGGARELGDHMKDVVLVSHSAEAAAQAVLMLLCDPPLARRIGNAARAHVMDSYGSETLAINFENLYAKVARIPGNESE